MSNFGATPLQVDPSLFAWELMNNCTAIATADPAVLESGPTALLTAAFERVQREKKVTDCPPRRLKHDPPVHDPPHAWPAHDSSVHASPMPAHPHSFTGHRRLKHGVGRGARQADGAGTVPVTSAPWDFDLCFGPPLKRIPQLYATLHTPHAGFYWVPRLGTGSDRGPTCDPMLRPNWGFTQRVPWQASSD